MRTKRIYELKKKLKKRQGIEGELACDAYETHLRIALERADLAEFTRCITSLNELFHKAHLVCQVHVCECIYIFTDRQTDTDRQTQTDRHRQTDTDRQTQTDGHRHSSTRPILFARYMHDAVHTQT